MNDEGLKAILTDEGPYDEVREGSARQWLTDFYGRQMRAIAVAAWVNALLAIALGVYAAVAFFGATEVKRQILYSAIFLTAVIWLTAAKVMGWLGIIQTSFSREIKRLEVRLSETAEAVRRQSNS
jgi:signal transduction histidine kinase